MLLLVAAVGVAMWVVVGPLLTEVRTDQALAGLFGVAEREALIDRWTAEVVHVAERDQRLSYFREALEVNARAGALVSISRHGDWCAWEFSQGERWEVRHAHPPHRNVPRAVVATAAVGPTALTVHTYVPGRHDLTLPVLDARPIL